MSANQTFTSSFRRKKTIDFSWKEAVFYDSVAALLAVESRLSLREHSRQRKHEILFCLEIIIEL